MRVFTSCGCGVMALAITPPGEFGDLPVFGKASNRGLRPWLRPVRTAGECSHLWRRQNNKKARPEIPQDLIELLSSAPLNLVVLTTLQYQVHYT